MFQQSNIRYTLLGKKQKNKKPHYIQGLIGRIEITEEIVSEIEDKDTLSNLNNRGEKKLMTGVLCHVTKYLYYLCIWSIRRGDRAKCGKIFEKNHKQKLPKLGAKI